MTSHGGCGPWWCVRDLIGAGGLILSPWMAAMLA